MPTSEAAWGPRHLKVVGWGDVAAMEWGRGQVSDLPVPRLPAPDVPVPSLPVRDLARVWPVRAGPARVRPAVPSLPAPDVPVPDPAVQYRWCGAARDDPANSEVRRTREFGGLSVLRRTGLVGAQRFLSIRQISRCWLRTSRAEEGLTFGEGSVHSASVRVDRGFTRLECIEFAGRKPSIALPCRHRH